MNSAFLRCLISILFSLSYSMFVDAKSNAEPFWVDSDDVPLDARVRSVEFLREDEPVYITPNGARRGLIIKGAKLPLLGVMYGQGCRSRWLLVGPQAYVCGDHVQLSFEPYSLLNSSSAFSFQYYSVGSEGADVYKNPDRVEDEVPIAQLERGWIFTGTRIVSQKNHVWIQNRQGYYINSKQVFPIDLSRAQTALGIEPNARNTFLPMINSAIKSNEPKYFIGVGWVITDRTPIYFEPKLQATTPNVLPRFQRVHIAEIVNIHHQQWVRIAPSEEDSTAKQARWLLAKHVRIPMLAKIPSEVQSYERWIDIDRSTQTLVAYVGSNPVFATLISTGRASTPTPQGVFRIWLKLRSATMSNALGEWMAYEGTYSIENVPWVQYFSKGVALHGAFWHRRFGEVHSHGCVNLTPEDAKFLFDWSLPEVSTQWSVAFPTTAQPATWVQVR